MIRNSSSSPLDQPMPKAFHTPDLTLSQEQLVESYWAETRRKLCLPATSKTAESSWQQRIARPLQKFPLRSSSAAQPSHPADVFAAAARRQIRG
jgi:hypothetical protein